MTETTPDWLYNQSAVIAHRMEDGELRLALITSMSGRRWVLPKGVIDPGESAAGSAQREALEEAGL
ncbi:MAG: NUDIX domain-containing protein, partial [Planctomycetota bacterium]|nr:NUDIX domain-containing protein [Planctomycetota bacterium]